jgi:hypothetical protein
MLNEWRRGFEKDDVVRTLIKTQGAAKTFRQFTSDPANFFTPKMQELFDLAEPGQQRIFRRAFQQSILENDSPLKTLQGMQRAGTEREYGYLFESPAQQRRFESEVLGLSRWKNSPQGKMAAAADERLGALKVALEDVQTPVDAHEVMSALGPRDQGMLQEAVIDRVVRRSRKTGGESDQWSISSNSLEQEIGKLKDQGLWDEVLTEDQQGHLKDLASYQRVFFKQMKDVGSSLENASLVSNLKAAISPATVAHPGEANRVVTAAHGFMQNKMIARWLTNPKRYEKVLRRLEKEPRRANRWATASLLGSPVIGTIGTEDVRQRTTPGRLTLPPPLSAP